MASHYGRAPTRGPYNKDPRLFWVYVEVPSFETPKFEATAASPPLQLLTLQPHVGLLLQFWVLRVFN